MTRGRFNWANHIRPVWRVTNRIDAFQLRHLGFSLMSVTNPGSLLVLETTGRRTGTRRFTPLGYWEEQGVYFIGGGAGGMSIVPDWLRNLQANANAAVWIRRSRISVRAEELQGAERDNAQQTAASIWRGVPRYAAKAGRVIPYFRLVPDMTT